VKFQDLRGEGASRWLQSVLHRLHTPHVTDVYVSNWVTWRSECIKIRFQVGKIQDFNIHFYL
jgi:hypothetical protein